MSEIIKLKYQQMAEWVGLGGPKPDDASLALYLMSELGNREEVDAIESAVTVEAIKALSQRPASLSREAALTQRAETAEHAYENECTVTHHLRLSEAALREALTHVDDADWDYLQHLLIVSCRSQDDSQTRIWIEVMPSLRAALKSPAA